MVWDGGGILNCNASEKNGLVLLLWEQVKI